MNAHNEWTVFVSGIEHAARSASSDAQRIDSIVTLLDRLLKEERRSGDIIPQKFKAPRPGQYAQYLMHKAKDDSVCVVSVVWPAGQSSPIHDHQTWGVVGVLQNQEKETSYRRVDDGGHEDHLELEVIGAQVLHAGDITTISSPTDFHRAENAGSDTAISIHIYGKDIGATPRRVYDPVTKTLKTFVSGYTQPE